MQCTPAHGTRVIHDVIPQCDATQCTMQCLLQMKRKQQKLAARGMLNEVESETLGPKEEGTATALLSSARSRITSPTSKRDASGSHAK